MKFSCFKRDFMGAPIRRALKALHKGSLDFKLNKLGAANPAFSCEISYRPDEKYWVLSSKTEVTVAFALNFDNVTDRALARTFLLVKIDSFYNCRNFQIA